MKKIYLLVLALLFSGAALSHAAYFDIGVSEIPLYIIGVDTADKSFYSFMNVAYLRASLNLNDDFALRFRLTDTYFGLTNSSQPNGTNKIYVDRLYLKYTSDQFGITLGRDVFAEADGMVLGNLSDGLMLKSRFLIFEQHAYVMYSGLVPKDVNDFNVTSQDRVDGAQRLQAGIFLQKHGVLVKNLGVGYLYSADLNQTNADHYNPSFLSINANGRFGSIVNYGINLVYALGQFSTNNVDVSALAFDVQLQLNFSPKFAVITRLAYAGGDDTNSTNTSETFNALGVYNTGQILVPDFANLLMFHLGFSSKLMDNKLGLGMNLLYMTRLSLGETLGGFYDGTGSQVGTELSANISWQFDPNMSVLLSGGYFWKGDAFDATAVDLYKLIAGIQFKL